jgi:transcriptional regulator NrdR family protein
MKHIVKRNGYSEEFDERKIYGSVFSACMTLRMTDEEGELIADTVTKEVTSLFADLKSLTGKEIHKAVTESLRKYNPDAAYMYDTHKDIA